MRPSCKNTGNLGYKAKELLKSKFPRQRNPLGAPIITHVEGKYKITFLTPGIKNLALRGGGAKGIAYGPSIHELNKAGMLKELERTVGSSAGAIMALVIATGNLDNIEQIVDEVDMNWVCRNDSQPIYPEIRFNWGYIDKEVTHGYNAVRLFDEISSTSVQQYLADHWDENFEKKLAEHNFLNRALELKDQDINSKPRKESNLITFNDVYILNKIAPEKFKETILTAFDENTLELHHLSVENVPNMPLAYAARASMAIPPMFTPVEVDLDKFAAQPTGIENIRVLKDGGIGSNLPSDYLYKDSHTDKEEQIVRGSTLLMTFDDQGNAYDILHTKQYHHEIEELGVDFMLLPKEESEETSSIATWFSGNPNLPQVNQEDKRRAYEGGINTFIAFHGKLGTFDMGPFAPDNKSINAARFFAWKKAVEQINWR